MSEEGKRRGREGGRREEGGEREGEGGREKEEGEGGKGEGGREGGGEREGGRKGGRYFRQCVRFFLECWTKIPPCDPPPFISCRSHLFINV